MSLWTYMRSSAFKRPSDIVLRWSDLTNPRAELARSTRTDAVVTGVTSGSFRTCRTFGNKSSCPETLVFFLFFFFWPARGGGASPPPPPGSATGDHLPQGKTFKNLLSISKVESRVQRSLLLLLLDQFMI